ncbi:hypothetical protein KC669_04290 [Candidatus Dojkabacteria bacterium]|uniref:Uncharacterized protein n=1 Tax=Candidatus Dojkabacteria bacterium TaxID=2099670 RepID=A0A955LBN1_9BACT|nr:hypothetical protein [Candidatus Dojkabacteria bacterium]
MIHKFPSKLEKKLNFNKEIILRTDVHLDFSSCSHNVGIRDLFEKGHAEIAKNFPEFASLIKYSNMNTEFDESDLLRPKKISYTVEMKINGARQYAMSKQTMEIVAKKWITSLGINATITITQLSNVSLSSKLFDKFREVISVL